MNTLLSEGYDSKRVNKVMICIWVTSVLPWWRRRSRCPLARDHIGAECYILKQIEINKYIDISYVMYRQ